MTFFTGQLNLLRVNCDRLFNTGDADVSYEETLQRIKDCHYHHLYLMKYSSVLNKLLSPVMFLYVIICSLMLCASAIQLTTSNEADRGIYSSKWYTQNTRVRRSLLLLGGQLRKTIVFTAGPFTKLNIATFVAILKGSYSYYTLLDKKED
ncbi:unnamed protein product [Arctia plantaginis]|uniref:Uncharacterized protein n=1 Tax=Arctia plantaginis TaxID=874455 RepID=A0A8S0ZHN0_ARCPL|nr:unnamed protein product [Arctia plantaginis]